MKIKTFGLSLLVLALPIFASAATLTRELDITMRGDDVSTLQTFLAKDTNIYPEGLVTGYFGDLTQRAVSKFQTKNGIASVGRVGPITLTAINSQMNDGPLVGYDRQSPIISYLNVNASNVGVSLSWNTNENASAIVYYSSSPIVLTEASANMGVNISGNSFLVHSDLRTTHSASITGLMTNTTYNYVVYVRDGSGNVSVTPIGTFRTSN